MKRKKRDQTRIRKVDRDDEIKKVCKYRRRIITEIRNKGDILKRQKGYSEKGAETMK